MESRALTPTQLEQLYALLDWAYTAAEWVALNNDQRARAFDVAHTIITGAV